MPSFSALHRRLPRRARPVRPADGSLRALARTRRSSAALEFGFVAVPFLTIILGALETSYDLYVQAALIYATRDIGRAIYVGELQSAGTVTSASFVSSGACSKTAGTLPCSRLYVSAARVASTSDFWTTQPPEAVSGSTFNASGWTVCTGGPNNAVVLSTAYVSPAFVGALIPSFTIISGGQRVHVTSARLAFVNQGFTQTAAC